MLQDPLNIQAKDRQFSSGLITNRVAGTDQVPVSELPVSKFDYVRRNLEVQTEENALSGINVEASGIGRVLKSIADKEKKENDVSFFVHRGWYRSQRYSTLSVDFRLKDRNPLLRLPLLQPPPHRNLPPPLQPHP